MSSTGAGGCTDESGPPAGPCAALTDDFTNAADVNWTFIAPSSIGGGHATAVSNAAAPSSAFTQDQTGHPAFPFKECWVSVAVDNGDLGDQARAFVEFVGPFTLHVTVSKSNVISVAGSTYPQHFRGIVRLREHHGCMHVETAQQGDSTWTSVDGENSQPWLQMPGYIRFGIEKGDTPMHTAVFSNFNLPPAGLN